MTRLMIIAATLVGLSLDAACAVTAQSALSLKTSEINGTTLIFREPAADVVSRRAEMKR
jgi:hypothetical protein